jgi:hypothetical protein
MVKKPVGAAGSPVPAAPATLITPDGYEPPAKSQKLLAGVRFDRAIRVGEKYAKRFAKWDATKPEKARASPWRPAGMGILQCYCLTVY